MLIPFGLKYDKYHDISEVERGRACGCVCPSCKQNLVAKKGPNPEKMIHHFAHDKKSKEEQGSAIECEYSFCVVARLVIKQCFRELTHFEITLPEWELTLAKRDKFDREVSVTGFITQSHLVTIEDFEVEPLAPYSELDILCRINGYPIGLHFSYQGRQNVGFGSCKSVSIVDIDLEPLQFLYAQFDHKAHDSFKSLVMDYVLMHGDRHWSTHARYESRYAELSAKLEQLFEKSNECPPQQISAIEQIRHKPYKKPKRSRPIQTNHQEQVSNPSGLCVRCLHEQAGYIDNLICGPCLQKYYSEGIFHNEAIKKVVTTTYMK